MPRGGKRTEKLTLDQTWAKLDELDLEAKRIQGERARLHRYLQSLLSKRGFTLSRLDNPFDVKGKRGPGRPKKFKRGTGKYKPTDAEVAEAIKEHSKLSSAELAKNLRDSNKWAVRADRIDRIKKEGKKK